MEISEQELAKRLDLLKSMLAVVNLHVRGEISEITGMRAIVELCRKHLTVEVKH